MTVSLIEALAGGDLRSIGNANEIATQTTSQPLFDDLFDLVFHKDRLIAMRAADAIEKITVTSPQYLKRHKNALLGLLLHGHNIEVKWHVALLVSRIKWTKTELKQAWDKLKEWALTTGESRIVRVNAIQALYNLLPQCNSLAPAELLQLVETVSRENIPSVKARLKRLYNSIKAKTTTV